MSRKFILFSVGKLLEILAYLLVIPAIIAFFEIPRADMMTMVKDYRLVGFIIAIIASLIFGNILKITGSRDLSGNGIREGFAIVALGWLVLALFGSIPLIAYLLVPVKSISFSVFLNAFTDGYFEIMSGFTTTGATIFADVEQLPQGILFWRSFTHWLGGMGIITLAIAILPAFGIAGYQMFRGEVPGPTTEQLKPRLAQTAKILWGTYVVLTLIEAILLRAGGMPLLDASCHAFGTMATGGFSTKNGSIGSYNSAYIEWVIIAFMFLAGVNFAIHYRVLIGRKFSILKKNGEFLFYCSVMLIAVVLCTIVLSIRPVSSKENIMRSYRNRPLTAAAAARKISREKANLASPHDRIRKAAFQVVAITTTTGYTTADFDTWPNGIRYLLVILMFFGGCAGSTGGGMKMVRIMVMMKGALREIRMIIQPRIILPIKVGSVAIDEKQVSHIWGFTALFGTLFVVICLVMCFFISDFTTAITSVVATMCNIGPGLSGIGAAENYGWIPLGGKWVLIFSMLLGRLEIYAVIIFLSPRTWKK